MAESSLTLIVSLILITLSFTAPTPPIWGGALQYSVNVSMIYNKPVMTWNFTYYYNWNLKAERYEHHGPQADEACLWANPPFGINESCSVTFATDGWMYVEYPAHNWCCKCGNKFGAINAYWLNDNSTYVGTQIINGVQVTHWTKMGLYLNHYYSTVDKELPIRFNELKEGKLKQWDFDLKSYNQGPFDPEKLKPKCQNLCGGQCRFFRQNQLHSDF